MDDVAKRAAALEGVRALIRYIGDDPERPGLKGTPERVLEAWRRDWGRGYGPSPAVAMFKPEGHVYDQMVVVSDIAVFSTCEHHMAPFYGEAHIAYIPNERGLIGLSKLARIVDYYARRLQVQERLTDEIAGALDCILSPDAAVLISATHMCMVSRGVRQPNARTITSSLRGRFRTNAEARAEFFRIIGSPDRNSR